MSTNIVILEGYVGADPEIRTMPSGDKVANFSLATSRSWKNEAGETIENTDWHRLDCMRSLAGVSERMVKKGSHLLIEGELRSSSYVKDNQTHYTVTVRVRRLRVLDRKGAAAAGGAGDGAGDGAGESFEDDIPQ